MSQSNASDMAVVLTFSVIGPLVGSLTPFLFLGASFSGGSGLVFWFSMLVGIIPAVLAGLIYCQSRKLLEQSASFFQRSTIETYLVCILNGAVCGGISTVAFFWFWFKDISFAIVNPLNIAGAIAGAFCAFLLAGNAIEQISSTATHEAKK